MGGAVEGIGWCGGGGGRRWLTSIGDGHRRSVAPRRLGITTSHVRIFPTQRVALGFDACQHGLALESRRLILDLGLRRELRYPLLRMLQLLLHTLTASRLCFRILCFHMPPPPPHPPS